MALKYGSPVPANLLDRDAATTCSSLLRQAAHERHETSCPEEFRTVVKPHRSLPRCCLLRPAAIDGHHYARPGQGQSTGGAGARRGHNSGGLSTELLLSMCSTPSQGCPAINFWAGFIKRASRQRPISLVMDTRQCPWPRGYKAPSRKARGGRASWEAGTSPNQKVTQGDRYS
jgi:hypothetical protein